MKKIQAILLYGCISMLFWTSCGPSTPPPTTLQIRLSTQQVDTLALVSEIKGILALSSISNEAHLTYDVQASAGAEGVDLQILPALTERKKQLVGQLLDRIIQHPSTWSPDRLELYYTGNDSSLLEMLQVDSLQAYPLEIDPASAYWTFEEKETYMAGPLASGRAITSLNFKLRKALPSTAYRLGFEGAGAGESSNEARDIIASLLSNTSALSASFTVHSRDSSIRPLWDSLQMNHQVYTDSLDLWINWEVVDFPYEAFNQYAHQDTLITASVEKLKQAPPYIFHTLLAPTLSTEIQAYTWGEETP